jgi:hypothetical protein
LTCRFVDLTTVEGQQSPPRSYYVRKVTGDTMSISTYRDAAHTQLTSSLIFTRVSR